MRLRMNNRSYRITFHQPGPDSAGAGNLESALGTDMREDTEALRPGAREHTQERQCAEDCI